MKENLEAIVDFKFRKIEFEKINYYNFKNNSKTKMNHLN
jgi:hypothetical protein